MRQQIFKHISLLLFFLSLLIHLWVFLRNTSDDWSTYLAVSYVALPFLGLAVAGVLLRRKMNDLCAVAVSAACACGALVLYVWPSPQVLILSMAFVNVFLMLFFARVNAGWYAGLAITLGVVVWLHVRDIQVAATAAFGIGVALIAVNYVVHLVIDHRREMSKFLELRGQVNYRRMVWQTIRLWLPTVVLIGVGIWLNLGLQAEVIRTLYESGIVMQRTAVPAHGLADLQKDVEHTINERRGGAIKHLKDTTNTAEQAAAARIAATPVATGDALEKARPRPINVQAVCSGKGIRIPVIKKSIPLDWLCREILHPVNAGMNASFDEAKRTAVGKVQEKANVAIARGDATADTVIADGEIVINEVFDGIKQTAATSFIALTVASLVSNILLVGGVVAGFNMVLARILFDRRIAPRSGPRSILGFRLEQGNARPEALDYTIGNEVVLPAVGYGRKPMSDWYVYLGAVRVGTETHMRLALPEPFGLVLSRIASGRYLMTKIRGTPSNLPQRRQPTISLPGDLRLVCIALRPGQELVFRTADLVAFSAGIRLKSVYTAHVGTHLLGLGSFHAIAGGEGHLVLVTEGQRVKPTSFGLSVPPQSLLCWDRRAQFTLAQEVTFTGIWFNDPSVVANSVANTGIIDEGRSEGSGLAARLWRVFRFLFLPF